MGRAGAIWLIGLLAAVLVSGNLGWEWYQSLSRDKAPKVTSTKSKYGFSLESIDGKRVSFSQFTGKVLLVNFWASWCGPCMQEFPSMVKLLDQYPEKLVMIAISSDHRKEDIVGFLKAFDGKRDNLWIAWDPSQGVSSQYGVDALPESFLFSPTGEVLAHIIGARDWSDPQLVEAAKSHLTP